MSDLRTDRVVMYRQNLKLRPQVDVDRSSSGGSNYLAHGPQAS